MRRVRGGYCYHLNGPSRCCSTRSATTSRGIGAACRTARTRSPSGATGNHLALTVANLPTADNPGGGWLVDAGLGDALHRPFVRTCAIRRRDASAVDALIGCVLKRLPDGDETVLDDERDWFAAARDVFGLPLHDVDRTALWRRVSAAHERWLQYSR